MVMWCYNRLISCIQMVKLQSNVTSVIKSNKWCCCRADIWICRVCVYMFVVYGVKCVLYGAKHKKMEHVERDVGSQDQLFQLGGRLQGSTIYWAETPADFVTLLHKKLVFYGCLNQYYAKYQAISRRTNRPPPHLPTARPHLNNNLVR